MEAIIFVSHICFRRGLKAQGIDHRTLPFHAPFAPWNQYICLLLLLVVMIAEFYLALYPFGEKGPSAENFWLSYLTLPLYVVVYFGYKVSLRLIYSHFLGQWILTQHSCGIKQNGSLPAKWIFPRQDTGTRKIVGLRRKRLITRT